MRNITYILTILLLIGLLSKCQKGHDDTDIPHATFKGSVKGIAVGNFDLKITIPNSITGDNITYNLPVDSSGKFHLSLPLAFATMAGIESKYLNSFISLSPSKISILHIDIDKNNQKNIQIIDDTEMSLESRDYLLAKMKNILMNSQISQDIDSVLSPSTYQQHMTKEIAWILSKVDSDSILSIHGKNILKAQLKMFYTQNVLMEYNSYMGLVILNKNLKAKELEKPDLSYYSFLKDINLSDSSFVATTYYHTLLQSILKYPIFEIQSIDEANPPTWINNVKQKLEEVVGDKQELFYDILLANSYSNQLNEMHPFSNKQIENIQSYYKYNNVGKVLLDENHKVNILINEGTNKKITKFEFPISEEDNQENDPAEAELFIEHLFEKYKNKVIVLDFWATWCGPCLKSMEAMKPMKKNLMGKNVVFVYITTESSPPKAWEVMKKDIQGDHYYVDSNTWEQFCYLYDFEGIPTIIVFDKQGQKQLTLSGYREGDDRLANTLDNLLKK